MVYKIKTRKENKTSVEKVPTIAKPKLSYKDSDVYEYPENLESTRYQGDPLATIQPNPSYDVHNLGAKKDSEIPVYANVK